MAQIALPRHQVTQAPETGGVGTPLYQRRSLSTAGPVELLPNPDFIFPLPSTEEPPQPAPGLRSNPNRRPMSLQAVPNGRRVNSGSAAQRRSASALPDFSFNPGGMGSTQSIGLTPPHSPIPITPTSPSRHLGHRRGGSEFIGGDGKVGGLGLLSTSPTKGDGVLPPPSTGLRPVPPGGRRGHAHRRSGAISVHDLPTILQPTSANGQDRSGSAPVTPVESKDSMGFPPSMNKASSQPSLRESTPERNGLFQEDSDSSPRRPPSRARVGFSDRVEYIRPLSTISSETESSMSTIRGHSVSNSLSSVVSSGAASPPSTRIPRPRLNTVEDESTSSRPSTAGAVLETKDRVRDSFGGDLFHRKRPVSSGSDLAASAPAAGTLPSPNIPPKRRSWLRFDHRRPESACLSKSLPTSLSEPSLSATTPSSPPASPAKSAFLEDTADKYEKRPPTPHKSSKKPRKVKSWANTIMFGKPKHQGHKKSKEASLSGSPRAQSPALQDLEDLDFDTLFDGDNTVTIVTPPAEEFPRPKLDTDIANWRPKRLSQPDPDNTSPVIDLDAALGPLACSRGHGRGFSMARRTMHSSAGFGNGLQNHRRAESAPVLARYEGLNSSSAIVSAMTDVFEEEEEEEEEEDDEQQTMNTEVRTLEVKNTEESEQGEEGFSVGIQVVESDASNVGSSMKWNFTDALSVSQSTRGRKRSPMRDISPLHVPDPRDETPVPLTRKPAIIRESSPVEVVEDYEEPRTSSVTRSSDSTVTPTMSIQDGKEPQPAMNLSLPLPQNALLTPDTLHSSAFPSPDFRRDNDSFDYPRLGTASSSMIDGRLVSSSFAFGEPGPEFRPSVDGTPSLTSSRSTMTSAAHAHFPVFSPRQPGDRSSSVSSIPSVESARRRKRSSIVSLSRLIGGSGAFGGERSKLNIEQRPQSEHIELPKDTKTKKSKRLSKLMHFWKSKDSKESKESPRA